VVETLVEVGLAQILPLTELVSFVLLKLVEVRFKALEPVLNELYRSLAYDLKHLFLCQAALVRHDVLIETFDELKVL